MVRVRLLTYLGKQVITYRKATHGNGYPLQPEHR